MDDPSVTFNDLDARLRFRSLWNLGITGEGVTVAVIDSGIHHIPSLEKLIVLDKDFTGENNPIGLPNSHATSIAACIHAVAPKACIANLKALSEQKDPDRETICQAIQFCLDCYPQYKIINLSIYFLPEGCCKTKRCILCFKVNEAVEKGITVITAAGNLGPKPGTVTCPGLADNAMTVGSAWSKQEAEWWEKTSKIKKWWFQASGEFGNRFGTSYSAAWTSGGVALLLSFSKDVSPKEIKEAIMKSAFKLKNAPGISGGMQCYEAFNLLLKALSKNNFPNLYDSYLALFYSSIHHET